MAREPLLIWPLDGLSRVFPHDRPPGEAGALCRRGWSLAGARGEYQGFQLGVHGRLDPQELQVQASPLSAGPNTIPASALRVRWVGLIPVPLDNFDPRGAERPDAVPGWYPDPLLDEPLSVNPQVESTTALWFTLKVARSADAGNYMGTVSVRYEGQCVCTLPLAVQVWPFAIPRRATFHVTNWFNNAGLVGWHQCEPWSARHWRLLDLYAKTMAAYRQDTILTPTIFSYYYHSRPPRRLWM